MTSGRSFSENASAKSTFFSKGRLPDFRRDLVWFIIYLLIFFFAMPVAYLFGIQDVGMNVGTAQSAALRESLMHRALLDYSVSRVGMGISTLLLCMMSALEAYHEFRYLHNRTAQDFYHALPGTRRQLYFSRVANGFGMVFLPYLICEILTILFAFTQKLSPGEILGAAAAGTALNLLVFALTFLVFVTAVMLTGKALTCVLGMAVFTGYFPVLGVLISSIPSSWFITYAGGTMSRWPSFLTELSPAVQAFRLIEAFNSRFSPAELLSEKQLAARFTADFYIRIAVIAAVVIGLFFLALWLYRRRALERCGEAMTFTRTESPIRILLVIGAGIAGMLFMKELGRSLGWVLFGTAAAVILSHLLIELIFRQDAKRLFARKWQMLIVCGLSMLLVIALRYDLFGFDRYLPAADQVEAADITLNGQVDLGNVYYEEYGANGGSWSVSGIASSSAAADYLSSAYGANVFEGVHAEESIAAIRRIAQEGIRRAKDQTRSGDAASDAEDPDSLISVWVQWKLKNGQFIRRYYNVSKETLRADYGILFDDPEYRSVRTPVMLLPSEMLGTAFFRGTGDAVRLNIDPAALHTAYLQDLSEMTFDSRKDAYPAGLLEFNLPEATLQTLGIDISMFEKSAGRCYIQSPVYPSFARTLALLDAAGIQTGIDSDLIRDADKLYYEYWYSVGTASAATDEQVQWSSGALTDPEEIRIVKEALVPWQMKEYNIYGAELADGFFIYIGEDLEEGFELYNSEYTEFSVIRTPEIEELLEKLKSE